jgi:hypothetical protein
MGIGKGDVCKKAAGNFRFNSVAPVTTQFFSEIVCCYIKSFIQNSQSLRKRAYSAFTDSGDIPTLMQAYSVGFSVTLL